MADMQRLIEQITSNDTKIRDQARAELVSMGSQAVEPLIAALDSPSDWQRKSIVTLLQQIKDPRVPPALLKMLNDTDPYVRGFAAVALAEHGAQDAIPAIQQMVETEREAFGRMYLLQALDKLGQREWVLQYTTHIMRDDTFSNPDRQAAIQMLVRFNDPGTADLLLEAFQKNEPGVGNNALQGLKALKDGRIVDILIAQLHDPAPAKRAAAAVELGNLGDERAVEPIKALLGDKATAWTGDRPGEPSTSVGQAAQDALKKLRHSDSQPQAKKPRWKLW
ncbi:MAG: HEAT repeat domain-containing protein [Anaerolineaceae bacterium]|nr:HEAT repeat domain-containing protein [Anaerolineaceae bacterium]